jgi:tripartite-type tricarboxylate transporter receptor subunit TctC
LGKPAIVVNRPGAQGLVGAQALVDAPADGYTLFFGVVSSLNKVLIPSFPFDVLERMAPVAQVSVGSFCIYANAKVPVATLQELVDYARQKPGVLNYGAQAASSTLGIEMLKHKAGIDIVSIPYQGGGPAVTALIANEIQILMDAPGGTILSSIETGTLRPLACSGTTRHKALPNVPTTAEAGFPDLQITVTSGFWAPSGIAPDRVKILSDAFRSAVQTPAISERIAKLGTSPQPAAAAELLERTRAERTFWIEAARLSNYQAN